MTNHHTRKIARIIFAAACAASGACSPTGEPGAPAAQVTVNIVPDGYADTRSSFTWDEEDIRDIQIVVTDADGEIHDVLYSDSPYGLHFTGQVGRPYRLWAAANLGGKVEAGSLEDFTQAVRFVTKAGIERSGIPMFSDGGYDITLAEGENHADIPLTRMMARVDFNIDTGSLERPYAFSVRSVTIFSPVDAYTPFDGDVRKEGDADSAPGFDSASARDISLLNNGGTIRLYAFENMQGTLLPGNTDPWKKVPSSIGDNAPLCTYIEAVCSYTTDTETCDDITYRMYLGENATTNFDVRRNTLYRLTLEPTEGEIRGKRGSWKIETGEWEDIAEVGLVLTPSRMELEVGETGTVSSCFVLTWPDGRCETLSAYSDWAVEGMGYRHVQLMGRAKQEPSMELKGRSPGYATVTATAEYDGAKYDAEMEVEVVHGNIGPVYTTEYEYELVVSPDSATLAEGGTVSFTATYITREYILADGVRVSDVPSSTTEDDVTEMANWTVRSGARYVTDRGTGVFGWASGPGTTAIEATFNGCSDTAEINTLAHDIEYSSEYEYELVVSPDSATLAEGETVSFTATYITREYILADGMRISDIPSSTTEDDVTEMANWTVRSGARYVSNGGTGVFGWVSGPGTAAIEASFNNCSDTAEVNTLAHEIEYSSEYEYELVVSPSSATLEEGGAVSFTATYITREYALEDGIRVSSAPVSTTEDDVTGLAVWSVRSGTRYVSNEGTGVFGWISGPGTAVIEATFNGCSDTAEINTLAHDIEYSSEYEYELVVNPDSATLAEGETVSFTATYITREYILADGVRVSDVPSSTTEDDVTEMANWTVRSGARYVTDRGTGVFGWASGPGTAAIEASFNNCSDTAEVNTLAHEIEYSSEYEYELVVSPSSATLEEGGAVSFTATYITREYALEDGIRVSSAPVSTTEDDVTGLAVWSVRSGTRYISNEGTGVFGWVSGPGTAVIEASYGGCSDTAEINASEPDPVPSLTASVSVQDTWGGNEYPVTLTYDDGRGHLTDVSSLAACTQLDFTGGIPSGLLEWDGGHIVAEDWWGMSGAWVTSSPAYSMTMSYEGLSVEISGTMHGFTGAEISLGKDVWHYREVEDNGWSTPPVTIMLTGSERLEVTDGNRYVDSDYVLGNGYIGLGTGIPLYVEFTDPSNGYGRSGSTEFDVITNVVSLHAYINVYFMSGASGETVSISNTSTVSGAFFGVVGITGITDGYPPYGLVVQQSIWYVDYRGETHSVTSQYGQDDDADDISISDEWSLENQWDASIRRGETHLIGIDVNGFSASWQWGYVGG